jgi:hypothetical protein
MFVLKLSGIQKKYYRIFLMTPKITKKNINIKNQHFLSLLFLSALILLRLSKE